MKADLVMEPPLHRLIIEPGAGAKAYWRDLWRYRELLFFLAWRDLLVQYKQTALGLLWAVIRPTLPLVVLTVVFGNFAKLPSGNVPYPLMVFAGLLPWQFFAAALLDVGNSVVGNGNLISKIYFPRLIIPFSATVRSVVDLALASLMLAVLMVWYRVMPDARIVALPLFLLLGFACALGLGLWMAALTIKYRDLRFLVPFVLQFGLYVSPIGFSSEVVPEKWRFLYFLNPMAGVIDGCRWALLNGAASIYVPGLLISLVTVGCLLITGILYFRKTERTFADLI